MTREEAVKTLIDMANALCLNPDTPQGTALKMAIKALEHPEQNVIAVMPCEDAISRQATLEPYKRLKDTDTLCVALIRANIIQQPSIKLQKPKTGHWIKDISENGITSAACCSECGFEDNRYMLFRYCPSCSTRMESKEQA